jgi:hypothetical protein
MYALSHLNNHDLLEAFSGLVAQDRRTTAALLAYIAEIDARHLYLQAGFESMKAYCMAVLHLSEQGAYKRLLVARLGRHLPAIFPAIADGRLHVKGAVLLSSRLTSDNADDLIAAAANRPSSEIELMIASRFPRAESLRLDDGIAPQVVVTQRPEAKPLSPGIVDSPPKVRTRIEPLSAERFTLQVTLPGETHDKLRRLQDLLGHAVPNGDVAQVLDRAFDALMVELEKRKFGGASVREPTHRRAIHAQTRKAVYERDRGRCVALLEDGRRCGSTKRIEFDHIIPLAKGGKSTIDNLRTLCRAHNQAAAEQEFGIEFVERKKASRRPFASR